MREWRGENVRKQWREGAERCNKEVTIAGAGKPAQKDHLLFPSLNVRSSGGLWSPPLPGDPSRSSAGLRFGDDDVNHTSERGSVRTCARCREGRDLWGITTGGALCTTRSVLRTKLLQRKKDKAGVDSFRIEAIASSPTEEAFAYGGR